VQNWLTADEDVGFLQDPLVEEGHVGFGDAVFGGVESVEVAEEDAEGVAQAAVGFGDLLEEVFAEGDFGLPVDGGDPQSDDVGAVFVVEVGGVGGFAGFFVVGLGGFLSGVLIDDKAVGHDGFVGSMAAPGGGEHEGTLEPAAVLIGGF